MSDPHKSLVSQAEKLADEFKQKLASVENSKDLYSLKVEYLGKKGSFSDLMKSLKDVPADQKAGVGESLNQVRKIFQTAYDKKQQDIETMELEKKLTQESLDLSLPGPKRSKGALHPLSLIEERVIGIFSKLGFSVRLGPLCESEFYNFEALNIPKDHPARDMQDTFFLEDGSVMRTHTSPVQIHVLENEKPPFRVLAPGSVFRCDSDITHAPHFHQLEGLCCDKEVSMADLKGTLSFFIREFLGTSLKTRFRPSYFPFTEPSAEVDFECPICRSKGCSTCSDTGWIEIGGCGLVHPAVFEKAGVDSSQYKGFAFGLGIERLTMIYYDLHDIRVFCENDIRFLKQFAHEGVRS